MCTKLGSICQAVAYNSYKNSGDRNRECYVYGGAQLATTSLPAGFTFDQGTSTNGNHDVTRGDGKGFPTCWIKDKQQPPGECAGATTSTRHQGRVCVRVSCACACLQPSACACARRCRGPVGIGAMEFPSASAREGSGTQGPGRWFEFGTLWRRPTLNLGLPAPPASVRAATSHHDTRPDHRGTGANDNRWYVCAAHDNPVPRPATRRPPARVPRARLLAPHPALSYLGHGPHMPRAV